MRLRNVKNKQEIMNQCSFLVKNPELICGSWQEHFGNSHPIEIEIGMGKGDFIVQMAVENPMINYIGIEKSDSIIACAIKKVDAVVPNLRFIQMDAIHIDEVFSHEVEKIYLNFSDPWPKKRHARRRLTSSQFLAKYDTVFRKNKVIVEKTDNALLFEFSILSLTQANYQIKEISLDLENSEIENQIQTEYEKKFRQKKQKIYYLCAYSDVNKRPLDTACVEIHKKSGQV